MFYLRVLIYRFSRFARKDIQLGLMCIMILPISYLYAISKILELEQLQTSAVITVIYSGVLAFLVVFGNKYEYAGKTRWVAKPLIVIAFDVEFLECVTQEVCLKDLRDPESKHYIWVSSQEYMTNGVESYFPDFSAAQYFVDKYDRLPLYGDRPLTEVEASKIARWTTSHDEASELLLKKHIKSTASDY